MKQFKRIGVLTSGGDAPGMNAAIRAVTRAAIENGVEVMGIYRGYSGLISGDIHPLALRDVSNILNKGGTMLYSDRCPEFVTREGQLAGVENCRRFGIDGIIVIGGDGTFQGGSALTSHGIPCIGLPGTIDNDIATTDNTIGFNTAMNTVIDMVDKLRDTCESHARCSVIEVMGRGAGDIALETGIASGATAICIPELPVNEDAIVRKIEKSRALGKRNFIVMVSEGLGSQFGPALTEKIERETGVETRFTRLGHVVRGGNPSLRDRVLATEMGAFAVDELLKGRSDIVICEREGRLVSTDIRYSLILDRMWKNKLKAGDLERYSEEEVAQMKQICEDKMARIRARHEMADRINL